MASRDDLQDWICEALRSSGGSAKYVNVAKFIWQNHEQDLRASGDLFFTWQYDMRWAANLLRKQGLLKQVAASPKGVWVLQDA